MHKTMAATALSFLMAVGGGVAFAEAGGQTSSSAAPSAQSSHQQNSGAMAQGPVGFAAEEVQTGPWTVQRIDKQNRDLVLRAADGTQSTISIPAGTPGFDTLKKGDEVQLDYFDAAVVGPPPAAGKTSGQSPSGSASTSNQANHPASEAAGGQAATGNASGRKVRSIRKVGHNSNMGHSQNNGSGNDTGGGTSAHQPAQESR